MTAALMHKSLTIIVSLHLTILVKDPSQGIQAEMLILRLLPILF